MLATAISRRSSTRLVSALTPPYHKRPVSDHGLSDQRRAGLNENFADGKDQVAAEPR